ncbi:MAG: potassium transporter TrkG [Veillonella caviae]|nr:potassium transporter TrkG [Veillonella caviae]
MSVSFKRKQGTNTFAEWYRNFLVRNPQRMLAISFAFLMILGGALLTLPMATVDGSSTHWVDAFFVAVSCASVTGLTPVDTFHHWSVFGQTIMIILIQIGGLGTMTFTTLIFLILRRRVGLENRLLLQEDVGLENIDFKTVLKQVVGLTFVVEAIGGVIYTLVLYPYLGIDSIYYGFYQSISSFCNAGFVFFDNNLPYELVHNWGFTLNTSGLILLGGFGYMASFDILRNYKRGFKFFALHTKVMLIGEAILVFGGTALICLLEWNGVLDGFSFINKWQAALMQAVTPRTAGLPTLDYSQFHPVTTFITIILMFIGAGPNSTGGGVKISTVAVLWATAYSVFTNKVRVQLFNRSLSQSLIIKSCSIIFFSTWLVLIATFILSWVEPFDFLDLVFEVTSAFATVGLTRGITGELTDLSKIVLMIVMYTGRIGVLTLIGAFFIPQKKPSSVYYPEDNVLL